MNKLKAWMFNRKASSPKNKPEKIMRTLALQPGQHIADIGVGGGYFSVKFSKAVGDRGTVYAVDINQGFLDLLLENARRKGLRNIKAVPAREIKSLIPEKSLDCIFLRNVYHHLENRVPYFRDLSSLLKDGGKIAIIEYKGGGFSFHRIFGHHVPQEKIIKEMEKAGYEEATHLDFLPEQSFTTFKKKG